MASRSTRGQWSWVKQINIHYINISNEIIPMNYFNLFILFWFLFTLHVHWLQLRYDLHIPAVILRDGRHVKILQMRDTAQDIAFVILETNTVIDDYNRNGKDNGLRLKRHFYMCFNSSALAMVLCFFIHGSYRNLLMKFNDFSMTFQVPF